MKLVLMEMFKHLILIQCKLSMVQACIGIVIFITHRLVFRDSSKSAANLKKKIGLLTNYHICHLSFLESKAPFSARGQNGPWWTRCAGKKV